MSFDTRQVSSAEELRALSHEIRLRIVEELTVNGAMTATELAATLDSTAANCSWHLRKLAEHGFVEETHDGHGRRRPWRMRQVGFSLPEPDTVEPPTQVAAESLLELIVARDVARFHHNRHARPSVGTLSQTVAFMTPAEELAFREDLEALVNRYHDRLGDSGSRPEGVRPYRVLALLSADDVPEAVEP